MGGGAGASTTVIGKGDTEGVGEGAATATTAIDNIAICGDIKWRGRYHYRLA
jgi:hypothetical protein